MIANETTIHQNSNEMNGSIYKQPYGLTQGEKRIKYSCI